MLIALISYAPKLYAADQASSAPEKLSLQAPSQSFWLGEPSDWLLIAWDNNVAENSPTASNSQQASKLILPTSNDFIFTSSTPTPVNENGVTGLAYPIRITPLKAGELTLPAFELQNSAVQSSGQSAFSEARKVQIQTAALSKNMQLSLERSQNEIYLGQTFRLKVAWLINYPVKALQAVQLNIAEFHHPDIDIILPWDKPDGSSQRSIGIPVSGQRIIGQWRNIKSTSKANSAKSKQVKIEFEVVVKPTKAGDYHFPAASLLVNINQQQLNVKKKAFSGSQYPAYFDNNFFESNQDNKNYRREQVLASAFSLKVKALPSNAPENFTGIIGKPNISVSASPTQVQQGQPIQYSLQISHDDIEAITMPILEQQSSFNRSFNIPGEASPALITDKNKTIHQSLFPRRADIEAIPALNISYFEPSSGLYRQYTINSVAINVSESDQFDFSQGQSSDNLVIKNSLSKDDSGIWAHRWGKALEQPINNNGIFSQQNPELGFAMMLALILLCPPLLTLLSIAKPLLQRRQQQRMLQPVYRLQYALDNNSEPLQALSDYLEQRLAIVPSQLSSEKVQAVILQMLANNRVIMEKTTEKYAEKSAGESAGESAKNIAVSIGHWIENYQRQYSYAQRSAAAESSKNENADTANLKSTRQLIKLINALESLLPPYKVATNAQAKKLSTQKNSLSFSFAICLLLGSIVYQPQKAFATETIAAKTETLAMQSEKPLAQIKLSTEIAKLHQAHQQALQLSIDSPAQANIAHSNIAAKLESLLDYENINSAALMYNIGSSWFHSDRYGKSILWLRRAQALNPDDELIRHNLSQARDQRLDDLPQYFAPTWLSNLHQLAASSLWQGICVLSYFGFWYVLYRRVINTVSTGKTLTKQPQDKALKITSQTADKQLLLASVFLVIVSASQVMHYGYSLPESDGVITSIEVTSRKGPGLIFAPAFTTPLNQGTEFILLSQDGNWSQVQLSDESIVWLPNRALDFI